MKLPKTGLIAAALLSACAAGPSEPAGLSVIDYSRAVQSRAADEIEGGRCPVLGDVFMPDYSVLRDQARVR